MKAKIEIKLHLLGFAGIPTPSVTVELEKASETEVIRITQAAEKAAEELRNAVRSQR